MTVHLSRRSFLQYGAAAMLVRPHPLTPSPHAERRNDDFDLEEVTIAQLQDAMRAGSRSSRSVCAAYLARIAELDPKLHSVIETNPDALAIADRLDAGGRGRVCERHGARWLLVWTSGGDVVHRARQQRGDVAQACVCE
jgi:hypothetical protein